MPSVPQCIEQFWDIRYKTKASYIKWVIPAAGYLAKVRSATLLFLFLFLFLLPVGIRLLIPVCGVGAFRWGREWLSWTPWSAIANSLPLLWRRQRSPLQCCSHQVTDRLPHIVSWGSESGASQHHDAGSNTGAGLACQQKPSIDTGTLATKPSQSKSPPSAWSEIADRWACPLVYSLWQH